MTPEIPTQDPQATATPELSGEELLDLIRKPLDDVLETNVEGEVDFEKQRQLLRLEKCDKYIRGLQFLQLDDSAGYYGWQSLSSTNDYGDDGQGGVLDYNIDIIDSYRKKYISTLGLRPFWNAAAVPDDPQSEIDRKAARQANLCAVWMRNKWKVRSQNIMIFDRQYSAGTLYIHNPFVADKEIFGEVEEPIWETKVVDSPAPPDPITGMQQPSMPMEISEVTGTKKYPATGPAFYIYDGTMVTVPFSCRDFRKVPWLLLEKEENRGSLLQMYGEVLRSRLSDSGELKSEAGASSIQEQGRRTRGSAESLSATYRPGSESQWTHSRYWLSTCMYEFFRNKDIRELLYEKFPKGLHIAKVEGVTVRVENADLNAEWGCITPFPGSTIYQDPVCWGILGNQDIINLLANIAVAREERGLPTAICDAELIDTEEIGKRRFLPNELVPAKAAFGGSLREAIVPLPTPNKDDGAGAYLHNMVVANTETRLGLLKSVWGAQSEQKTASGQRMEIQQGLMQLGVPGEMVSQGFADAYMRGSLLIAENAPKGFVISDDGGATSEMLDIEALKAGKYHFEVDPGMPMTRAEMADRASGIIQENPEIAMAMGFNAPLAATALRELLIPGMPDIPSPLADVREKVVQRIQILLQQQPAPGQPDPVSGQPGPMLPSIMPEEYVDDPAQHAELTREWLNTGAGRKINPFLGGDPKNMPGYQNVVAYGLFCTQKAMPPPPPPTPPKVSVSVKGPELLMPGVPEAVNATAGTALPPAPPPQQQMPGMPPNGMNGAPPPGPQQPMAPSAPEAGQMPAPPAGPMIQ